MKCHYEILSIARNADDNAIKTAYRKLALRWHPDKNPENLEIAKENFQLIQQAYDVLSDPQERAWYDSHHDQILRGSHTNYEDNSLDVFQFFTTTCFRGYGDDSAGFYTVYRKIFEMISTEDVDFMDDQNEFKEIPNFGRSNSDYDTIVGPFYAYWQSYCTKKTYSWLCQHNLSEIRDRRILREIEKETKKITQKARKERNDEIRALVAFVRKRDRRVLERKKQLEEKAELNRIKQHENRLEQLRRNKQEAEQMQLKQRQGELYEGAHHHEEQLRVLEEAYASSDEDIKRIDKIGNGTESVCLDLSNDADDFVDTLYCIACNKTFKTESSFRNHESSKRHKENVENLKIEMRIENDFFDGNSSIDENSDTNDTNDTNNTNDENVSRTSEASTKSNTSLSANSASATSDSVTSASSTTVSSSTVSSSTVSSTTVSSTTVSTTGSSSISASSVISSGSIPIVHSNGSNDEPTSKENIVHNRANSDVEADRDIKEEEEEIFLKSEQLLTKSKLKKKKQIMTEVLPDEIPDLLKNQFSENEDDNWNETGKKKSKKGNKSKKNNNNNNNNNYNNNNNNKSKTNQSNISVTEQNQTKSSMKEKKKNGLTSGETIDIEHTCVICKSTFPSKNKLFNHLKSTGHGVYIDKKNPHTSIAAIEEQQQQKVKKKQFYSKVTI